MKPLRKVASATRGLVAIRHLATRRRPRRDRSRAGSRAVGLERPAARANVLVLNPGTSASAAYFRRSPRASWRGRRAGRSGRSSAARTCSRTTRCSTGPRRGRRRRGSCSTTTSATSTTRACQAALPAHRRRRGRLRPRVGDAHRGRGPPARRPARERPRREGGARRPLARRLDHDGLRDLGLRGQAGREGPVGPGLHRRRQRPRRRSPRTRRTRGCASWRPARRGCRSAGSPRRSPACSTPAARRSCGSRRTRRRSPRASACCPRTSSRPCPRRTPAQYGYALDTATSPAPADPAAPLRQTARWRARRAAGPPFRAGTTSPRGAPSGCARRPARPCPWRTCAPRRRGPCRRTCS